MPGDNIYLTAILNILETFSTIGEAEGTSGGDGGGDGGGDAEGTAEGTLIVLLVLFFSCFMMIHMINIFCSMGISIYLYSATDPHKQAQTK